MENRDKRMLELMIIIEGFQRNGGMSLEFHPKRNELKSKHSEFEYNMKNLSDEFCEKVFNEAIDELIEL